MPTTIISMVLKTSPKISERGRKEKKNELQKAKQLPHNPSQLDFVLVALAEREDKVGDGRN